MVLDKFGKILGKAATGLGEKKPYVIKWPEHLDPEQYIAWRYPHTDIPFLSVVIVDEAQKALFFRDGKLMGVLDSGRHTLDTQNIPFLRGLVEGAYGETIFKATIVFVNLRQYHENFGGRAFVDAVGVHLLFNGTYYYTVDENRLELFYVRLMGTKDELTKDDVKAKVTPFINRNLIELFGEYAVEQMRQGRYIQNVSDFMAMLSEFGEGVKAKIAQRVNDYFGLKITDVLIETLDISEEDKRILQMSGPRAFAAMYERDWAGREAISKNLAQAKGTAGTVAPFMMFPWMMYPPYPPPPPTPPMTAPTPPKPPTGQPGQQPPRPPGPPAPPGYPMPPYGYPYPYPYPYPQQPGQQQPPQPQQYPQGQQPPQQYPGQPMPPQPYPQPQQPRPMQAQPYQQPPMQPVQPPPQQPPQTQPATTTPYPAQQPVAKVKCPYCGRDIPVFSPVCPYCANPIKWCPDGRAVRQDQQC